MTWVDALLWTWAVCSWPVIALVVLCFAGSDTAQSKVFTLIYGAIAVVLSPIVMMWIILELASDGICWLRGRA